MPKKNQAIPVNTLADDLGGGVSIDRLSLKESFNAMPEAKQAHREDRHSFFLLESGTVHIEIDFETVVIASPSVVYMHPNQVHRMVGFTDFTVSSWAMNNESLNPEYLQLLEGLVPAKPVVLNPETFELLMDAVRLCTRFAERRGDKLHHALLKDGCNALVVLVISQYLSLEKPAGRQSRPEEVTKAFKGLLGQHYTRHKRPAAYAQMLNISVAYLNECVKSATGYPVSHQIAERVMLEAKRLLHHSGRSVKEIAAELGYEDYPYFSRLFRKSAGLSALAFRGKNRD